MNLKKGMFVLVMLVCLLALSLGFAGCGTPAPAKEKAATDLTITVSGIPATYNNKYGAIALFKGGSTSDIVAISENIKISDGSVTMDLIDYIAINKGNLKSYTKAGKYNLLFNLYDTDKSASLIKNVGGITLDKTLSNGDNTFDFSIFR